MNASNVRSVKKKTARQKLKHEPYQRFKAFLIENRIKQSEIAKLLKIANSTVNQKINGYLDFEFNEIEVICIEYGISSEIFRSKLVS